MTVQCPAWARVGERVSGGAASTCTGVACACKRAPQSGTDSECKAAVLRRSAAWGPDPRPERLLVHLFNHVVPRAPEHQSPGERRGRQDRDRGPQGLGLSRAALQLDGA